MKVLVACEFSQIGEEIYLTQYFSEVQWLILGAQSGPGVVKPKLDNVLDIIVAASEAGIKLWIKNNLLDIYPGKLPRRQELPNG